jgi:hypothetical protein
LQVRSGSIELRPSQPGKFADPIEEKKTKGKKKPDHPHHSWNRGSRGTVVAGHRGPAHCPLPHALAGILAFALPPARSTTEGLYGQAPGRSPVLVFFGQFQFAGLTAI